MEKEIQIVKQVTVSYIMYYYLGYHYTVTHRTTLCAKCTVEVVLFFCFKTILKLLVNNR